MNPAVRYLDVDEEPGQGSVVTDGQDRWERDMEGWWLLGPFGRESPDGDPVQWDRLLDMCGRLAVVS